MCVPPSPRSGMHGSRSEFLWGLYLCIFLCQAWCPAESWCVWGGDNRSPTHIKKM